MSNFLILLTPMNTNHLLLQFPTPTTLDGILYEKTACATGRCWTTESVQLRVTTINPVIQNFLAVSLNTQGRSTFSFIQLIWTFSDDVVDHELGECNFLPSCYEVRCSLRLLDSISSVKKFPFPDVGNINRLLQPASAWYLRTGPVRPNLALTALEQVPHSHAPEVLLSCSFWLWSRPGVFHVEHHWMSAFVVGCCGRLCNLAATPCVLPAQLSLSSLVDFPAAGCTLCTLVDPLFSVFCFLVPL